MATDFKYAGQSDLNRYCGEIVANTDTKRQIYGWKTQIAGGSVTTWAAHDSGLVEVMFKDGDEMTVTTDAPDTNGEYRYLANGDYVTVCLTNGIDPNDFNMEAGVDSPDYYDQMLVDASMELNNLLDARYPTPLLKIAQIDQTTDRSAQTKEYDAIVIKMTCYIAASNTLRATGEVERADYYYDLVTNADKTGMVDRLNAGEFKLSYEVDAHDRKGKVNRISVAGSMNLVETAGEYYGEKYDVLKIECTTTGAYGVAKAKVYSLGDDKIYGKVSDAEFITGGLQSLSGMGGLLVRFQGASMTDGDIWEIEVSSAGRKITNAQSSAIDLTRRGHSY